MPASSPERHSRPTEAAGGVVVAVRESVISIESADRIIKNEVGYLRVGPRRLKCEVLRIRGRTAELQVYEDTRGVRVGDRVELTGELLSVALGPGLLGQVYDGLQNPLRVLALRHGFFLPTGDYVEPLDMEQKWPFAPSVKPGATVYAGDVLGTVGEGHLVHKVMVPFAEREPLVVDSIHDGNFTVDAAVARLLRPDGSECRALLGQRWPMRRPLPEALIRRGLNERIYPGEPLVTTIRLIDTFFPVAYGGTACIPGPFGAGKTVLQNLIARHAAADVVVIVACGERAGEVVETINSFPELRDPRTGGSLMDRTVIICNTSSMPVAARESSIYTGITIGEYYRQMGYNVLVIADSTSRWAQALRETSGRMEEIPGEEAFPAYLDSAIKALYERAGVIRCHDGSLGSLTIIGTVSPAGGNLEEPVTQATLNTVKTFLGLSAERAYRRFYPAIDPLVSWSRYIDQLGPWLEANMGGTWLRDVRTMTDLLKRGDAVAQMMQVTGEEGVTLEDYVLWHKAVLLDMSFLQQNAFDPVDGSTPLARQRLSLRLLRDLTCQEYRFAGRDEARDFFTRLTDLYRNFNYSEEGSDAFESYRRQIEDLAAQYAAK